MKISKSYSIALCFRCKLFFCACLIFIGSCSTDEQNEQVKVKNFSGSDKTAASVNELSDNNSDKISEIEDSDNNDSAISPEKVKDHIGEIITVKGNVSDVHVSEKVAYLNFGKKFPKNDFSGVVFAGKFSEFDDLEGFKDKLVEITGSVSVYRNKPQVILNSSDQIKILK